MIIKPKLWQIPTPNQQVDEQLDEKIRLLQARLYQIFHKHQCVKVANSLAAEDVLMIDVLAKLGVSAQIFTLDTGRLNAETVSLFDEIKQRYPNLVFERYEPQAQAVASYISTHGENAFYDGVDLRKQCCFIRKVEPLGRALLGADAWLTGQRRQQSATRDALAFFEHDTLHQLAKYNPIYDWSEQQVWAYVLKFGLPYNALYEQGYPSIGCQPCTLPVKAGDDIRTGRWWWESKDSKECGLHQSSVHQIKQQDS
ncbi:phosphoadenosine phosphosulfate reductase [Moraxella cuniculi DSM 21768]|uniref:Adenosine 5'-phosphosulfate reductase n=1 Tax=Moraxella cuniculi DSM 21768 TaxID=1122245 RepID=A0A1N7DT29_9GAMM|nr:phosphoadenylyl-sulfate reductase [Moraxella cuniculi]OOS07450.1 phosphoadenosine phosphosulfate reductase [Moraxella cuniculi]SIR79012.1 phosphoadenosine phosphosulfate reductase [Moraxella cuniculi DSM 21768]